VIRDAVTCTAADGITCLAGIGAPGRKTPVDISSINRTMVLENDVVFGSVNANRAHYRAAADALAKADKKWLARLITRRVPLSRWQEAFERRDNDIKVIVDFTASG
jgi:threonine dehydrogenase-like Zn-dependent dehydrogenase